jgi:SPP1 gp7 family putative phage head morphogenesis protein
MRRRGDWSFYTAAELAADDLLREVCGVEKAAGDILSRAGFDDAVRRLLSKLQSQAKGPDAAALKQAAQKLDVRWGELSEAQRNRVITAAADGLLKVPRVLVPKVTAVLRAQLGSVVAATREASADRHALDIAVNLSAQDGRVIAHAAAAQGNYITDQYGNRAIQFEQRARDLVSEGLEKGLGREEIGENLARNLVDPMLGRAASYWNNIASIHIARSRSYGMLASYEDAGIEEYTWVSVIDEATTEVCRFMNGKTFSTGKSMDRYRDVEASSDPYAVEDLQPFVKTGAKSDGTPFLYVDAGGSKRVIAQVDDPGYGTKGKVGDYSRAASTATLQSLGLTTPPLHGYCRSTLVP